MSMDPIQTNATVGQPNPWTTVCMYMTCSMWCTLQANREYGYFTRHIRIAKVHRSVTTTSVVAGTPRSDDTASGLVSGPHSGGGGGIRGTHFGGTSFGGRLRVRAGYGKLGGTGGGVLVGSGVETIGHVALLSDLDSPQWRR